MGVLIRLLGESFNPLSQVLFRAIVSFSIGFVFLKLRRKRFKIGGKKDLLLLVFIGVLGYGFNLIAFTNAILNAPITNVFLIFSIHPILAAILSRVILKEKVEIRTIISIILSVIGIFVIFNPSSLSSYLVGSFWALAAAFSQATYNIGSRILGKKYEAPLITSYSILFSLFLFFAIGIPTRSISIDAVGYLPWILVLIFGLNNYLAWHFINKGFQVLKVAIGSVLMLTEPLFATTFAYLFFREVPQVSVLIGGLFILSSVGLLSTKKG